MNQPVKITDAELAEIKMLQTKFQDTLGKFGLLGVEKMNFDRAVAEHIEKEKKTKEEWVTLQKMEQDLLDKIVKTYGTGNLNMADGTFTPADGTFTPTNE